MLKVVLDTNVFISAIISPKGICARILRLWIEGSFVLFSSEAILEELKRVLAHRKVAGILKKLNVSGEETEIYFQYIQDYSYITPGKIELHAVVKDPGDDMFLACALEANADYIVSGDAHLCSMINFHGVEIVSPAEFLKILET